MNNIKVISFDADDTLWVNEPYFQETEHKFCQLLEDFMPQHAISRELLHTEMQNLPWYGYGVKSFILSMIETAVNITGETLRPEVIQKVLQYGKEMIDKPIELLDGVEEVLQSLQGRYRLVVATKGDLLDQERKLKKSGLEPYFHHIEIMTEKTEDDYRKLIRHLDIQPEAFAMIGNSLKSDILPVVNIGAYGFHVPYHTTWAMEHIDFQLEHENFHQLEHIRDVLAFFAP